MIVVDTNVLAYLLLPGDQTEAARRTFVRDPAWAAPALWRSELRNVLALYVRQRHLALVDAVSAQAEAEALLAGREYAVESAAVLALADQSGRSAYDCECVAVAQALGVPLVTSDRQLLRSFPSVAVALHEYGAGAPDA